MTLLPFDAPRLKLRRARHHIDDLTNRIREFLTRRPFYLELAADPTFIGGKKWVVRAREEVPLEYAAIIGDAVHNLRSALDLLACDVVRANRQSDESVYFPFASSQAKLPEVIKQRHLDRAKPAVYSLIVKWAPYNNGNVPLRAIHDFDIMDKHQALIPTVDMLGSPQIMGIPYVEGFAVGPIHNGAAFQVHKAHAHLPVGLAADGEFDLRFNFFRATGVGFEEVPFGGGKVIPTLTCLANLVENMINEFIAAA